MRRPDVAGIRHRVVQSTLGHWSVEPGPDGWEIHADETRLASVSARHADAELMACARDDLAALLDYVRHLETTRVGSETRSASNERTPQAVRQAGLRFVGSHKGSGG